MKPTWIFFLFSLLITTALGFQLEEGIYRTTQKNIIFGAFVPGSSHVTWCLRFLDEVARRGHNVTFLTVDENVKYGKAYPRITTISIGPSTFNLGKALGRMPSHPETMDFLRAFFQLLKSSWRSGYEATLDQIEAKKADVIICDHFSEPCMDASMTKKLPLVLTSVMALYPDATTEYINGDIATMDDLTTQYQSIQLRLYNKFILPLRLLRKIKPPLDELTEIKRVAGVTHSHGEPMQHALKIVSTVFGLDAARPTGPLIEMVGPLFSTEYQSLDAAFEAYLSKHKQVIYVAFGQHAKPGVEDAALVLTTLIHQYEKGHIDGIIWSSGNACREKFPATVVSAYSGKTYDIAGLFDNSQAALNGDLFITKWSPQMAVLLHPSVSVFLSHGGANSLIESLHAQKRLIFYPFFGDQPATAKQLSRFGLSEYFDHHTDPVEIDTRVEKVILDVDGLYQHHVRRYQALIQIHSNAAPSRAADLVEEAAFATQGPRFPHRHDVGSSLSFAKRYNLDLYAVALVVLAVLVGLVAWVALKLARRIYVGARVYHKTKTL